MNGTGNLSTLIYSWETFTFEKHSSVDFDPCQIYVRATFCVTYFSEQQRVKNRPLLTLYRYPVHSRLFCTKTSAY